MELLNIHSILFVFQKIVSVSGILIILTGVFIALARYFYFMVDKKFIKHGEKINDIRLHLGRTLILGLEFIVAADLIGTTTTPDYYTVGLLAIIVAVRTLLSYSLSREIMTLDKDKG